MIEERAVALLHLLQVALGDVIAHAGPRGALRAALDLLLPRPRSGLGLHQPVGHCALHSVIPGRRVSAGPGIHSLCTRRNRGTCGYGFRIRRLRWRPGMTARAVT